MPYKPKSPCRQPGCPNMAEPGKPYCAEHMKMHPEVVRSAASRGYDSRWRKFSKQYLKAHPLCVQCMKEGKYTKATVVDHIIPFRGDKALQYDPDNLQALCKPCHDKKTGRMDSTPVYRY